MNSAHVPDISKGNGDAAICAGCLPVPACVCPAGEDGGHAGFHGENLVGPTLSG